MFGEKLSYSNLAETILDYAMAEAKRTESEKVSTAHLLAAIRQWNVSKFDELFPEKTEKIMNALAAIPSQSVRPIGPDTQTMELLEKIDNPADAWQVVETLLHMDFMMNATSTEQISPSHQKNGEVISEQENKTEVKLSKIPIDRGMALGIAAALHATEDEIENLIVDDIAVVTFGVTGSYSEHESGILVSAVDFPMPILLNRKTRSNLVTRLALSESVDASDLARAYALGLVATASFAASIDEVVTSEEIASIDDLRVVLRNELAAAKKTSGKYSQSTFDDIFVDIIGLDSVKKELRQRIDYFTVVQRRTARGLRTNDHSMHMAFLGNPGTGKTTVARLFAKVLSDLSFLESEKLVEVDRSGLIGEFIGHTEKKTNEVVDSALGGVLFIDEAYALVDGYQNQKGYGDEAIDVLVKRMEDNRDRLMVVVAGYDQPMQEFLANNEGLKSRIPVKLKFPDYSANELVQVAERFAVNDGFHMEESCIKKFQSVAVLIVNETTSGNARDIRNVYERTVRNQFTRIAQLGDLATTKEMVTLIAEDVDDISFTPAIKKQIGFR